MLPTLQSGELHSPNGLFLCDGEQKLFEPGQMESWIVSLLGD